MVDERHHDGPVGRGRPGDGRLATSRTRLLHHSDRDSQYSSEQFQRLMADSGIVCSMSRSGNVWTTRPWKASFSSLKTERTARKAYQTRNEARADVFDYIGRHSTIGYISPVEFERKVGLA